MTRSALSGLLALVAIVSLGGSPANAGGWCACDGEEVYARMRPLRVYAYEDRIMYRRYGVDYYAPPARFYGYAYPTRGPASLIYPARARHW